MLADSIDRWNREIREKALQEGLQKGFTKGRQEGLQKGLTKGRQEDTKAVYDGL